MRKFRALAFILLYAALGAGVVFLFGTQAGLQWAWRHARPFMPASLHVAHIQGRLIGPITLDGVDYKTASMHVRLKHLHMQWSPLHLFTGTVDIDQLHIHGLHITRTAAPAPKPSPPSGAPQAIHLPVFIHMKDLNMSDFSYRASPPAKPFVISHLRLSAGYDIHGVYFNNLVMKSPLIDVRGGASLARSGEHAAKGGLDWLARPPGYPPVTGHMRFSGSLNDLHIRQTVEAPYAMQADIEVKDPFTRLHWRARIDLTDIDLARLRGNAPLKQLSGTLTGSGNLSEADTRLHLQAQARARATLRADAAFGWHHRTLQIKHLTLTQPGQPARFTATGSVSMGGGAPRTDITAQWKQVRWPLAGTPVMTSPGGHLWLKGTPDNLLAQFQAQVGNKGNVSGHARIQKPAVSAHLAWKNLRYPLNSPRVISRQGQLDINGTLSDYRLKASAGLDMPGEASGAVKVSGHGDKRSFTLASLDVSALGGHLRGSGRVAWKPALSGRVDLKGEGVNPGAVTANWSGSVNFRLKAQAALKSGQPRLQVSVLSADGRLRGQPLSLHAASLGYGPAGLDLNHLQARLGANRLAADGHVGRQLDLTWQLNAGQLSTLLPQAAGSLQGSGRVHGRLRRPAVKATLQGKSLRYGDDSLKGLALQADIDPSGQTRSHLILSLTDLQALGQRVNSLKLTADGTPASHQVSLQAQTPRATASLTLHGALDRQLTRWQFRIVHSRINPQDYPPWQLTAPAQGVLSAKEQRLQRTCWASNQARLCLSGQRHMGVVQSAFSLQHLPIAYFAALLPATLKTEGRVSGQGQLTLQNGNVDAKAHLETSAGQVTPVGGGKKKPVLKFAPSRLDVVMNRQQARVALDVNLADGGSLQAQSHITSGKGPLTRQPLRGTIKVGVDDISFIPVFVPELSSISGRLQGQFDIGGTLASPRLNGQMRLANGQASLVTPGISVKDLTLGLQARGSVVQVNASARSGGGELRLRGQTDLAAAKRTAALQVQGKEFLAMDLPSARVFISPNLKIHMQGRTVHVTGGVDVPKADITPKNIPSSGAVTVSSDQEIIRHGKKVKRALPLQVYSQVRLVLGKHVHFEGFGLKTNIQGNIMTSSQPGKLTTASGQLQLVNGGYKAYGQDLNIETGKLLFSGGPVNNPGVDVRAVRPNLPSVTVGVHVTGSVKNPQLSLFSQPPMTQEQQLSWLVLGRPLTRTSSSESSALSQAALALGLKGGNFLTKNLGSKLGLDTFTFENQPTGQTAGQVHTLQPPPGYRSEATAAPSRQASLVLGKYLTPQLFVSYGIGLFDRVSTLRLRYTLSQHWSISSESSTRGYGGDINYSIER